MKKSERLNDILLYLRDKSSFHLKELMERYSISKSTALRDVQSLEEIGMPLYSKPGRYGCYSILPNRLLSPIVFTMDEVQALYFSMLTLSSYQSTPFHLKLQPLKEKFEACIPPERIHTLQKMEKVFSFGVPANTNSCAFLPDILHMAAAEQVCRIEYQKAEKIQAYNVQFFEITSQYGQWYATGYSFPIRRCQTFRCDKILSIEASDACSPKPLSELRRCREEMLRRDDATEFEIGITLKGVDIFRKENYPSMELFSEAGQYHLRGFFNKGEENFIAAYLLQFGDAITSIRPARIRDLLLDKAKEIQHHISALPQLDFK